MIPIASAERPGPRIAPALGAAVVLIALVAATFAPSLQNGWVDWDDRENYLENPAFRGLAPANLRWAATTNHLGVYQPLSWVLSEAEYVAFGLEPRGYHLVSLALHAAVSALLFVLIRSLIGRARPDLRSEAPGCVELGAFLATALYAMHPLRVEVVAWNSCQQYLPAAILSILAVLAYLRGHPAEGRSRGGWVVLSWALLLLAMLAKAAAVGVAGALIVLDAYPLRRLGRWSKALPAVVEKVPFLVLAAGFSLLAMRARSSSPSFVPTADDGPAAKLARASFGVVFYGAKTLLPTNLCTNYFLPEGYDWYPWPAWPAILGIAAVTIAAALAWRWTAAPAAAWVAFLVLLAPTSGAIQLGTRYASDRYTYFPSIPLAALMAGALAILARRRSMRSVVVAVVLALIAVEACLSWRQSGTWRDSERLARQVLASNPAPPPETLNALGRILARRGDRDGAKAHYRAALGRDPSFAPARVSLGLLKLEAGAIPEAIAEFREAARIDPGDAEPHNNLGAALGRLGRLDEAIIEFAEAVRLRPNYAPARDNLRSAREALGVFAPGR